MTDTLTRWGDIALHLGVSEKTAMRRRCYERVTE